jgi:hypothetical protein
MLVGVQLGCFLGMMFSLKMKPMRNMCMIAARHVISLFMILSGLLMMLRGVSVMFGCLFMMFRTFECRHVSSLHFKLLAPHRSWYRHGDITQISFSSVAA